MDVLSIAGIALAMAAILGGNIWEGGHISAIINGPAFLIVTGGCVGATMLQTPMRVFVRAFKMVPWVFKPPKANLEKVREQIIEWATKARKEGLLGLESIIETEPREFYKKGLQLMVDGTEPEALRGMLELEVEQEEKLDLQAAKVFDALGGYAPTVGIIGAVLGLIHVMGNLADPASLGPGIATAFVATVYGVGYANLFFLPIGSKLKVLAQSMSVEKELVIDGLVAIAEGENPKLIEVRLESYIKSAI